MALLAHAGLILLALIMIYPVIWMVLASLRPQAEIFADQGIIPKNWTFENYINGWNFFGDTTFGTFFVNSFIISGLAVIGNVMAACLAGYAFARLNFRWKSFWFAIMIGSIMLPIHAQLIPQYIVFVKIGWINTILPLVVPKFLATDAFFIFLMVQFMRTLPRELEQAAMVDGASYWQRFTKIILPLCVPAIVTTSIFTFINTYNDFLSQLIYLSGLERMTVSLGLRLFVDTGGGESTFGGMFAMATLAIGPMLGFFIASQRFLVKGVATQGFK
ncbi:carbohydrate ABC transporter permease [Mariluticola halotolerans]|nr:carbohydrate ABC transporter permease [Mariluticola halotolerans]UJQ94832.1 carbohydrate ABC transporter permease [Mariluticola halotolerans]